LLNGVELVRDSRTLEPSTEETRQVINHLRNSGALVGRECPLATCSRSDHFWHRPGGSMPTSLSSASLAGGTLRKSSKGLVNCPVLSQPPRFSRSLSPELTGDD
jgi:hypothetical protein